MYEPIWQYIAFVVAACILIWGVIELNRRLYRSRKTNLKSRSTWIRLDPTSPATPEDIPPDVESAEQEETVEADMNIRAKQNGHRSESKNPT